MLHALQEHVGWISPGALNYVAARLTVPPADVYGVATFYALFSVEPRPPRWCTSATTWCAAAPGRDELIAQLEEQSGRRDRRSTAPRWLRSPCLGQCDRAPAALLVESGERAARARAGARVDAAGSARGDAAVRRLGTARSAVPAQAGAA